MPADTMRTRAGAKSLLTWVRVDQTTRSPSFNRLGLIATCGSCHVGAHVHDVSGAHRPARHDEPAVPVDVLGEPPQRGAVGEVHLDVPARRGARAAVALENGRRITAELPEGAAQGTDDLAEDPGSVDPGTRDPQRRRRRDGQL